MGLPLVSLRVPDRKTGSGKQLSRNFTSLTHFSSSDCSLFTRMIRINLSVGICEPGSVARLLKNSDDAHSDIRQACTRL